jgi:hypothetical protein
VLGEKNDEDRPGDAAAADETPHCPPPRWATGLRRVLYPDVTMDDSEADIPDPRSGS